MYRMALMVAVMDCPALDMRRCMEMCLVHDLAEAIVGDITPECGVSVKDKHRMEREAMEQISASLGSTPEACKIKQLCEEYEANRTAEAHFVHELDKLECALQTWEYEMKHGITLDCFIANAEKHIKHPTLRKIMDLIIARRSDHKIAV